MEIVTVDGKSRCDYLDELSNDLRRLALGDNLKVLLTEWQNMDTKLIGATFLTLMDLSFQIKKLSDIGGMENEVQPEKKL